MIGKIEGTLSEIEGNIGIIETTSGISYEVFLTPRLITEHIKNRKIELYTYLQVKDDDLVLFGFENLEQKKLFKMLIGVSGVGPKTAFGIISFSNESELFDAVRANDVEFFSKVPGLGKKTAMKILIEVGSKLKSDVQLEKMYMSEDDKTVIDALVSLGFKSHEAKSILSKLPKDLSLEEKIKESLKKSNKQV